MRSTRSKKVLLIAIQWRLHGAIGGLSQRIAMYAMRAYDRGFEVECLTSWSMADHLSSVDHPALTWIDDRKLRAFYAAKAMVAAGVGLVTGRYTRVHFSGGGKIGNFIFLLASRLGIETSCTFGSRTLDMASYGKEPAKTTWINVLNAADRIDVLNPGHDLYTWREKISVSKCSFPSRLVGKDVRLEHKLPLMVFCGALITNKNPLLAIQIAEAVRASGTEVNLVMFGDGMLRRECEGLALAVNEKYGSDVVTFGAPDQYFHTLSKAALFLSLQEHDNYPSQSLMEAMAHGCRCVCTADGDTLLMFPDVKDENILVNSRVPTDFVNPCVLLLNRHEPSLANSEHINFNHNILRFSEYFDRFLGLAAPGGRAALDGDGI